MSGGVDSAVAAWLLLNGRALGIREMFSEEERVRQEEEEREMAAATAAAAAVAAEGETAAERRPYVLHKERERRGRARGGEQVEVVGVYMRNWDVADEQLRREDEHFANPRIGAASASSAAASSSVGRKRRRSATSGYCTTTQDERDARAVCEALGIELHVADFVAPYWTRVFEPFLEGYRAGLTPNPDVLCNREIKFDLLAKFAREHLQCDAVATGHYALLDQSAGRLYAGRDPWKDQTYFLSMVPPSRLQNAIFPLGMMEKQEVRDLARRVPELAHTLVADRKESMGICFIGKRKMKDFLGQYIPLTPGRFLAEDGHTVMGTHKGVEMYTIGQSARVEGYPEKHFVREKNVETGDIIVVPGTENPALFTSAVNVDAEQFNWLCRETKDAIYSEGGLASTTPAPLRLLCRLRHRDTPVPCRVSLDMDVDTQNSDTMQAGDRASASLRKRVLRLSLETPQRAIASGQIAVIYRERVVSDDTCRYAGSHRAEQSRSRSADAHEEARVRLQCVGGGQILAATPVVHQSATTQQIAETMTTPRAAMQASSTNRNRTEASGCSSS